MAKNFTGALQQGFGEGSSTRTDFNHQRDTVAASGLGNAVQDGFTGEEMLAEAATHLVFLL